ncbi:hypothetical protein M9Y10_038216 [Tritrichomonas musculus]|uniref:Uncharacterized protein n=1 Tax=Tritrichomonas musculus TaxID=1915356 RepID=A0ABR2K8N4_9EUKA
MEPIDEICKFNSMVIKAFSSSQDSLNMLSQYPTNEQSLSILVDSLFCNDQAICCENTKCISMKILTNFFDKSFSSNIADRLENYYANVFKSDNYNSSIVSSAFSIDLFASLFKHNPPIAYQILNDIFSIGDDRYKVVLQYTIRFVKKIQNAAGFENILLSIIHKLPAMAQTFNEMLNITPIVRLLIPVIVSQKIHLELFKYCYSNEYVREALCNLLQLGYLFESNLIFDTFVLEYINVFDDIISSNQQLSWKSDLLTDLRKTSSFRSLPFDSFFIDLIQKNFSLLEFSFENFNQMIEINTKLLTFFSNLDQLSCNSKSEEALAFSHEMMNKCRSLIVMNISKIQYKGMNESNSSISSFFEICSNLFVSDYINSMSVLSDIHSMASFEIIKEMVLKHGNNSITKYLQFIEIDKNCLVSFFSLDDKSIDFIVNFLNAFVKVYSPASYFANEYFHAMIFLIQNLQIIQDIDINVFRGATDYINKIQIIDESQFTFLITNPLFQFVNQKVLRKEMKIVFQKISKLSFIDKIIESLLSIPNLDPEIILDYIKEIPLNLLLEVFIPLILNDFISKVSPLSISSFIYSIIKRIKETFFPTMCDQIISYVKILCQVLNDFAVNLVDNFHIQKKIMKSLTIIYQISSLNIGILFFYKDYFIVDLMIKNVDALNSINQKIISDSDIIFLVNYFLAFQNLEDLWNLLLNDNTICLFLKTVLLWMQQKYFAFDLCNKLFNIFLMFAEIGKIPNPIDGLTDNIVKECLKKGAGNKLPYSMYLSVSYLFKLHPDLFSSIIQMLVSQDKSESDVIENVASTFVDGTKDQIISASEKLFYYFTMNLNSMHNFQII